MGMKNYIIISTVLGILLVLVEKLSTIHLYYKIITNIAFYGMLFITILIISSLRVDYKLSFSQFGMGCLIVLLTGFLSSSLIKFAL